MPHAAGVIIVGAIVITIVTTAGMISTTYVQFLKGAMLIVFSLAFVVAVCVRGLSTTPKQLLPGQEEKADFYVYRNLAAISQNGQFVPQDTAWQLVEMQEAKGAKATFAKLSKDGKSSWWMLSISPSGGGPAFKKHSGKLLAKMR